MRFEVVTLFPELFDGFLATSIVGRAVASQALRVRCKSPREFGIGRHRNVDDTPYGGGSGMVMRVDCIVSCLEALDAEAAAEDCAGAAGGEAPIVAADPLVAAAEPARAHRILMTPQGAPLDQARVQEIAARPRVALICGRYEGFDERVRACVDEEVSLGDFVLTGGEIAAMAVIDACSRLLPGVLGNADSSVSESHSPAMEGLLEYPQYTRPVEFRGARVPEVLQNGNHAAIAAYRRAEAERRTQERRPDLWARRSAARGHVK
ncbi:MAG: tRNA (guanosine(37)-N1)-methyltransferase TrmD [Byssovorax sp.]